jgi:hypothetical protein
VHCPLGVKLVQNIQVLVTLKIREIPGYGTKIKTKQTTTKNTEEKMSNSCYL